MDEQKYPDLVIKLTSTSETAWTLEGTEKDRNPVRLSSSNSYRIIPYCKVRESADSVAFKTIRYIAGCDFLDPQRQDKEGYKVNLEQDNIYVYYGTLTVRREGSTIGLYDYLKLYQGNASNPLRPPQAEIEFEEVVETEVAAADNKIYDLKSEAFAVLREVRRREGEEFVYDDEKLQLLSVLFDLTHFETNEEKFRELYLIADQSPQLLINSIANSKKQLFASVKTAEELNVISFDPERVYFMDTKVTIMPFKGKMAIGTQRAKLVDFLLTEDGKPFYEQLKNLVRLNGEKSLARMD